MNLGNTLGRAALLRRNPQIQEPFPRARSLTWYIALIMVRFRTLAVRFIAALLLCYAAQLPAADNSLHWNADKWRERVSADITSWDLKTLLENIGSSTGWDIYVEPDTKLEISTKFKDRPAGEALRLLLGYLSFVVMPQTNGPGKLY